MSRENEFEKLSEKARDFIFDISNSALEGTQYQLEDIEELIKKVSVSGEELKIISLLKSLGVLRGGEKNG